MRGVGVTGDVLAGSTRASRLRVPSWRDPRLAIGVVLVLGSVALGVSVIRAADDTVPVFAAGATLVPGTPVTAESLEVVRVQLADADELYLRADDGLPEGAVAVRTVGPGEVVPRSAVGSAASLASRPVTVPVEGPLPADIAPGTLVDIWIAETGTSGDGATTPVKALASVEVAAVDTDGGGLTAVAGTAVAVLLDDEGTARVLGALANGHRVDLVPVPGPVQAS